MTRNRFLRFAILGLHMRIVFTSPYGLKNEQIVMSRGLPLRADYKLLRVIYELLRIITRCYSVITTTSTSYNG